MAHDVFISYVARDKATADAACATLEARKVRCWIAPRDVLPGTPFPEALIDAINHSRVMVLVFSSGSNESPQVMREVERAVSKGLPIIPLRIEDVPLSKAMEYFISAPHWLDALTPPLEKHLQRLADTVAALLAAQAGAEAAPAPAQAEAQGLVPVHGPRLRRAWLAGAALLLVAASLAAGVGIGLGLRPRQQSPVATAALTPVDSAAPTRMPAAAPETAAAGVAPAAASTPQPLQALRLPCPEPEEVTYDGASLWVRCGSRLVQLELVEAEGRFRAAAQREALPMHGLTWDPVRQASWAAQGREVVLLDRGWNLVASYALPGDVEADLLASDGSGLWAVAGAGPLYRLQPGTGGTLALVDSYAAPAGEFAHQDVTGLAWDGERLWVLVDEFLTALDRTGQQVRRIKLPASIEQPSANKGLSWYGWQGLAWDGRYLWAAHGEGDVLVRVDALAEW